METQERNSSVLPLAALILAVTVGGYFLYDQPFVSFRPAQPEPYHRDLTTSEGIDARLWEDPFNAVFTSVQSIECGEGGRGGGPDCLAEEFSHELNQLAFEIRGRAARAGLLLQPPGTTLDRTTARRAGGQEPIVLMPVMVPGEPYAEQAEKRRRIRHAVVSGLGVAGYVPEVGESIGYVETHWSSLGKIVPRFGRSVRIPFEWFERDALRPVNERGRAQSVLVLWLDESALRDDPLRQVDQLLRHLTGFCERVKATTSGDNITCLVMREGFAVRLLGPATSGMLRTMVRHAGDRVDQGPEAGAERDRDGEREAAAPEDEEEDLKGKGNGEEQPDSVCRSGEPTCRLVWLTRDYLDDPEVWLPRGDEEREGDLVTVLRPTVDSTLDAWRNLPPHQRLERLPAVIAPLSEALHRTGEKVVDSDHEWYDTVAFFWALDALISESPQPSTLRAARASVAASLTQSLLVDMGIVAERNDPVDAQIESTITSAWKEIQSTRSYSPYFWLDWLQRLEEQMARDLRRHLARPDSTGLDQQLEVALQALAELQPAFVNGTRPISSVLPPSRDEIEERLEGWILANRKRLIGEIRPGGPEDSFLPRLKIFSSRATASAGLVLAATDTRRPGEDPWAALRRVIREGYGGAELVPMVAPDDQIVWAIVQELRRRQVDLCDLGGHDHVALVGEWDTFYGRALPLVFEAAIEACRAQGKLDSVAPTLEARLGGLPAPGRVHRFNYLRGLDGSLPSNRRAAGTDGRQGDDGGTSWRPGFASTGGAGQEGGSWSQAIPGGSSRRGLEREAGPRRYDYMRRVAQQLTELDMELGGTGESLQAIGVVGSDVYDKLLVLQALRRRFPQALFFTTDLDARLFNPDDYRWNRNLIVASGYGLRLSERFQRHVPPFRDSYQTATFLATQAAVGSVGRQAPPSDRNRMRLAAVVEKLSTMDAACFRTMADSASSPSCPPVPRLFEVARTGPYDITPGDEGEPVIHTKRRQGLPHGGTVKRALVASLLGTCLVIPVFPRVRRYALERWTLRDRGTRRHILTTDFFILVALTAGAFLVWSIYRDWMSGAGEPFELWEGISIWPTEMLRLAAGVLSVVLIARTVVILDENTSKLSGRYGLLSERPGGEATFWDGWWQERRGRRDELRARRCDELVAEAKRVAAVEERRKRRLREDEEGGANTLTHRRVLARLWHGLWAAVGLWWARRRCISINDWRDQRERVPAQSVWLRYVYLGRFSHRLTRLVPVAVLYTLLGFTLVRLFGQPHKPLRGLLAAGTDKFVLFTAVFAMIGLTFFVVDASRLCERFIDRLGLCSTHWPRRSLELIQKRRSLLVGEDAEDYLDAELIADRTEVVSRLILYPFIVLGIMVVSRIGFFDHWDWPLSLILIFGIMSAYALACAVVLRRAAERARTKILERLDEKLSRALATRPMKNEKAKEAGARREEREIRASQIRLLIEDVRSLRRGAFAPWTHHPIIKAVLIPFGGVGAVILLDLLGSVGL